MTPDPPKAIDLRSLRHIPQPPHQCAPLNSLASESRSSCPSSVTARSHGPRAPGAWSNTIRAELTMEQTESNTISVVS